MPSRTSRLRSLVERVAHLLPAQGPIGVFVHHNPLHAFEDRDFEDAVETAGRRFGCEPYLAEDVYREELGRGRIGEADLRAVVRAELGARADERVIAGITRGELQRRILARGIPEARGVALRWLLEESSALVRFRVDLALDVREQLGAGGDEAELTARLWRACLAAIERSDHTPADPPEPTRRADAGEQIHPLLIRFIAGYLDQGFAHWPMPGRDRGIYACFVEIYGQPLARLAAPWARDLIRAIDDDRAADRDGLASLAHSLAQLGVAEPEWESFLTGEALALRGWAGMVRQLETRPDRVPAFALPARLVDYLAVRLLLSRAAILRTEPDRTEPPVDINGTERAWSLFHLAQLCGLDAAAVTALPAGELSAAERELAHFDGIARRRLLHLAYERHFRRRLYDALAQHPPRRPPPSPAFQVVCCIDEREESLRRHLEEVEPEVETLGTAGFFSVAMYYQGAADAHARALCPVAVEPRHYVSEPARPRRGFAAFIARNLHAGGLTFGRGALITAIAGVLWAVPLVLRVLVPWHRRGLSRLTAALSGRPRGRLQLERTAAPPPLGDHSGFTVDEMAEIVRGQLAALGIAGRLAPLVVVLGHGSTSLNNPQESAHDCGACGGGPGGPNARAFAQMANDPRVRARLAQLGAPIPDNTWFVGGQRNTASSDIELYDLDRSPAAIRPLLDRARSRLERARRREAHERCRRFDAAPQWLPPRAALVHVQARSTDLAQPRPEYGHASNAACVIGRRDRTRGLFLDRRAFLASYDPLGDPDGRVLARQLAALIPVVAGINLEYYFGYVDPTGYGCGTKLPHNVTCLLGVMDGAQSDLRTGLPWQMLEIHEPVRLAVAIEAAVDVVVRVVREAPGLRRLVENRWIYLAAIDPQSGALFEIDAGPGGIDAVRYEPERELEVVVGTSATHYRGRRGHLPFATIDPSGRGREPRRVEATIDPSAVDR
jgi:uncharacterized protein YbcC (UPF0753/DUF2309 family)